MRGDIEEAGHDGFSVLDVIFIIDTSGSMHNYAWHLVREKMKESIDSVVDSVDRINKEDAEGNRLVRIHGVGFPVMFSQRSFSENTGVRFATLMRILCQKNGGAFVGLTWNSVIANPSRIPSAHLALVIQDE